ncbi:MAG: Grx4 family monothiol glutaredoxin [Methylotenera sp.]|uniref:Grx4 family monothiol glutaredoxin n=1 Tax=Methylotenera sp. TaxID=2051956 RepID=UPI0027218065|nr:Grx4 family monothiol glutaredoxin [Methylotenera sp.]MDO9206496.1 Grx4 family monothiol glutaredoxin [Methylotenera sp.]MDO9394525.1 Grx4 family monothiol glutaredoxin [Methylotenera sp.]MDP1523792.1 Grx4 family monothiol glutaredoxin [Methylotenera sp.]MDP2231961.1 Grx4 family monothiol glutaredoxin [Methylotenera sp.]MDP3141060.1 Grx4 family monothiol glutaredoxin [Methylotenera sp.]
MDAQLKIKETVTSNPVVLYMKGSPKFPQCGFSNLATQILDACHAKYVAVDVLADQDVREGIKVYANWPTIPQLYINGEFVGGSDIMRAMYESGELQTMLGSINQSVAK